MVQVSDKLSLSGSARNRGVEGRIQDRLGLLTGILLTKLRKNCKEPEIPRQIRFAEATKHSQIRREQREQTLGPILVHVLACILLLRMIDEVVHIELKDLKYNILVSIEPTARSHRDLGGLLHRRHRDIFGRLEDDRPLATDPRKKRGPVFVIMVPARPALLAPATRAAQRLLAAPFGLALVAGGVIEVIGLDCPFQLTVVFQPWISMEITLCRSKPSESPSPRLTHDHMEVVLVVVLLDNPRDNTRDKAISTALPCMENPGGMPMAFVRESMEMLGVRPRSDSPQPACPGLDTNV
jgi:hypothetical protein